LPSLQVGAPLTNLSVGKSRISRTPYDAGIGQKNRMSNSHGQDHKISRVRQGQERVVPRENDWGKQWVKQEIKDGNLTLDDVLDQSMKFLYSKVIH